MLESVDYYSSPFIKTTIGFDIWLKDQGFDLLKQIFLQNNIPSAKLPINMLMQMLSYKFALDDSINIIAELVENLEKSGKN